MDEPTDAYARYQQSLRALQSVPADVTRGLAEAQRSYEESSRAADRALDQERRRLAGLRRNAESRYARIAEALAVQDVRIPPQMRPEPVASGDGAALRQSLDAFAAAIAGAEAALRDAVEASRSAEADNSRRAAGAQQAAEALRVRQEKLRVEREHAAEEARASAVRAASRRRLLILSGGGLILAALIIVIVIVVTH